MSHSALCVGRCALCSAAVVSSALSPLSLVVAAIAAAPRLPSSFPSCNLPRSLLAQCLGVCRAAWEARLRLASD